MIQSAIPTHISSIQIVLLITPSLQLKKQITLILINDPILVLVADVVSVQVSQTEVKSDRRNALGGTLLVS